MGLAKDYDYDFEFFFWTHYPKRSGKANAEKEFLKLKFSPEQMCELKNHIVERKDWDPKWMPNKEGKTYILDPERFLKNRRFEDEREVRAAYKPVSPSHVEFEVPRETYRADPERAKQAFSMVWEVLH